MTIRGIIVWIICFFSESGNLSNFIINIDHYYYQNTVPNLSGYDDWVQSRRKEIESLPETEKQAQFMKTKLEGLQTYTKDILFVLKHLSVILEGDSNADFNSIVLMGHSLCGNADKKVMEELSSSPEWRRKLKAFISLDSRLNQLGLKTDFEIPTLVLGAYTGYKNPDPLRKLPPQKNLKLKILEHTTHVSFDDFSIFHVLGKDMETLKVGLNSSSKKALEEDLQKLESGPKLRFGEPLFLGSKEQMETFLREMNEEIVQFLILQTK